MEHCHSHYSITDSTVQRDEIFSSIIHVGYSGVIFEMGYENISDCLSFSGVVLAKYRSDGIWVVDDSGALD